MAGTQKGLETLLQMCAAKRYGEISILFYTAWLHNVYIAVQGKNMELLHKRYVTLAV